MRARRRTVLGVTFALTVALVGGRDASVAHALERPANDDFRSAEDISNESSFAATVDLSLATPEALEPLCDGALHTVWYRYEAESSEVLTAYASSPTAVASVGVYTGASFVDFERNACWASDSHSQRGLIFDAIEGTTYWVQVGTDVPASVAFEFGAPATVAGTVVDDGGTALESICVILVNAVAAEQGDPYAWEEAALTGGDGTYQIHNVAAGPAYVLFADCAGTQRPLEFYDDTANLEDAQVVHISVGSEISGIDAILGPPGPPAPTFDRAVTSLTVVQDHFAGFARPERILVTVQNFGPDSAPWSDLLVRVCPTSGLARCNLTTYVTLFDLEPGETRVVDVPWDGTGAVGDMTVTAALFGDTDTSNNHRSVRTSVLLPPSGLGVSVPQP